MKKIIFAILFLCLLSATVLPQSFPQIGLYKKRLPPGGSYVLDNVSESPIAAYSMRRLRTGYIGAAVRVIRLSDSQQFDLPVNFTKADADAIANQNGLEVVKFYDQSDNGRDLIFSATNRPKLGYLAKPTLDFGYAATDVFGTTASSVTVTAPKIFILSDTPLNGGELVSFDDGNKFKTYVSGQKYAQYNGATVVYTSNVRRGGKQVTSYFQSGNDALRRDSLDRLFDTSTTNAGDASATGVIRVAGEPGSYSLTGNVGEIIIFDGAVASSHRDYLETNQQAYFLDGNRMIVHGDSLGYGVGLSINEEEFKNYGAVARDVLGAGYDVYRRATPGYKLTDLIPEVSTVISPMLRSSASSNIVLLNSGWNDNFAGANAAIIEANFLAYGDALKASAVGTTRLAISSLPKANYSSQPVEYPTVRTAVNSWLSNYYFFVGNKYIDTTGNSHIGNSGDTTNLTYYTSDQLHLAAGGYNEWGQVAGTQLSGINADLIAPSTPSALAASSVTYNSATVSWNTVADGSLGGYRVQYSKDSSFTSGVSNALVLAGTTSANLTALDDSTVYYFKVAAVDAAGNYSTYTASNFTTSADPNIWAQILGTYQAATVNGTPSGATIGDIYGTSWQDIAARSVGKVKNSGGYFQKMIDAHSFKVRFGVYRGSLYSESVYVAPDGKIYEDSVDTGHTVPSFASGDVVRFELDSGGHIIVKHAPASSPSVFTTYHTTAFSMSNTTGNPVQFFLGARGDATATTVYSKPTFAP